MLACPIHRETEMTQLARLSWRWAALAAWAFAPAWALAQGGMQVVPGPNNQTQVRFNNDRCVVFFNSRGQRVQQSNTCNRRQIERAEQADARWRQQNAGPNPGTPQVVVFNNGTGRVVIDRNCVTHYDRDGDRIDSPPGCSRTELRRADQLMAAYRRDQGLDRPPVGGGGGNERPGSGKGDVRIEANGQGTVRFSNGCTVYYDVNGHRYRGSRGCDRAQELRADELMATYRQLRENARQSGGGA
jgi:hypothetical protein